MVELMLEGLRANGEGRLRESACSNRESKIQNPKSRIPPLPITLFHVDARVSDGIADVGGIRAEKFLRLLSFCWQAIRCRFFHGAQTLYYIPAPAKKSAILRDLFALTLLRPFFPRLILHWHAVGLGEWAKHGGILQRWMRLLLLGADPAIVIAQGNAPDAGFFQPKRLVVVPNGIPDPCPDFAIHLAERRQGSALVQLWISRSKKQGPEESIHALYLGHCTRSKGLFEALEAMKIVAQQSKELRWKLSIVGEFMSEQERAEAERLFLSVQDSGVEIDLLGFLSGTDKIQVYLESDILLFPSHSESFGLVAVEALACGLPLIGSDIPGLQAVLGDTPCARVPVSDSQEIATALMQPSSYVDPCVLRARYEAEFTLETFQARIVAALVSEPSTP